MDPQTASLEMMERFWTDWFKTLTHAQARAAAAAMDPAAREAAEVEDNLPGGGGGVPPVMPFLTPEMFRQFQESFLEALAKYCDEYMRSPQFLDLVKRSLDSALTLRQQVNDFLDGAVAAGLHPPTGLPPDQAVIVDAIRETERKLRDRLDSLSERIGQLESRLDGTE